MLVNDTEQFLKTNFENEAEIERVVQQYAQQIFGGSIIYLPQARLSTVGGRGSIPDALVIDVEREEWFVVEAERAAHGTWEHIAPQVSRQLAAVASPASRDAVLALALDLIALMPGLRQMFTELGVAEIEIHGRLRRIIHKPPTVAIPIDAVPPDLVEWVQTLRNNVKIWIIEKYVSLREPGRVFYSIPDENVPTITTTPSESGLADTVRSSASQLWRDLLDAQPALVGQPVFLEYGPRGGERRTFQGVIRLDGIEVGGAVYSPSGAAMVCIKQAGSQRQTANGWVMWKTAAGELLDDLYTRVRRSDGASGDTSAV
jgi:hypothetical protein